MEQQNQQPIQQPNQISIDEQKRQKSKRIKIALLALAAVLIVVGGIFLLRESSPPPVSEGKALVYGKAVALSDVMTIPDKPLTEGVIGAISEERFNSFVNEARKAEVGFLSQDIIFLYVVTSSFFDEKGEFQFELDAGPYVLCYFSPTTSSEAMRLEACGETHLETGEQLSVAIGKMFGTTITGNGIETILLSDIYPAASDSSDTSTWQTYRNEEFGFEVRYPPGSEITKAKYGPLIKLPIEEGTNLNEKFLEIAVDGTPANTGPLILSEKVSIGGNIFIKEKRGGAAAGNLYDTYAYLNDHGGKSYNLSFTLHSGNIYNYDSSIRPKKFDNAKESVMFDQILSTFRFVE